jgi:transcriptional regulator with XRE-family HTH domain
VSADSFGPYVRQKRFMLLRESPDYSLRRIALAVGLEPSFLSKIERGIVPPPSEAKIKALAGVLGEDADVLLAMAGKISTDLHDSIRKRPRLFAELIRELKSASDHAVSGIVREARTKYGKG